MRFTLAFISNLLIASVALADRRGYHRLSQLRSLLAQPDNAVANGGGDSNLAGVAILGDTSIYKSATGQFEVPVLNQPSGTVQIGIAINTDTGTCNNNSTLLAAITGTVDAHNKATYQVAGGFFDDGEGFPDFKIDVGDAVQLTVTATSSTTGTVSINNTTKHKQAKKEFKTKDALCDGNIIWFLSQDGPLPGFSKVIIHDGEGVDPNGKKVYPASGTVVEITENSRKLTHTTVGQDNTITIQKQ